MDELLDFILEAHGGLERWARAQTLSAHITVSGPFWTLRGFPDAFLDERVEIDMHRQRAVISPWLSTGYRLELDGPQQVAVLDEDGRAIEALADPRGTYGAYDLLAPWKSLQVGYFLGYAMWNYLVTPYLLTLPGVRTSELAPWLENGEKWSRLRVGFPRTIATHHAEQVFYFGPDGLLRRLDYAVDVNAGAEVAHYTDQYRTFDGLAFPTRRRVYRRNADGTPDRSFPGPDGSAIAIDIHHVNAG